MSDDLISRKWLMECVEEGWIKFDTEKDENKFIHLVRDTAPSAQPERKKGRWIRNDNGTYSCSVCQSWIPEEQHHYAQYCLYCGAEMRGEQNE